MTTTTDTSCEKDINVDMLSHKKFRIPLLLKHNLDCPDKSQHRGHLSKVLNSHMWVISQLEIWALVFVVKNKTKQNKTAVGDMDAHSPR